MKNLSKFILRKSTPIFLSHSKPELCKVGGGKFVKLFLLLLMPIPLLAQGFEVQLNPSMYAGGYNISCHGSNNGAINAYVIGGTAPFTFVWSNGATTKNLSNLTAGNYQVTVTSTTGASATAEINLIEPDAFYADLVPVEREGGYHISEFGGQDGMIEANITGGVPPYTYLWSSGQINQNLDYVPAGVYTLSVHDATNCVTNATVSLIEPTSFHIVSITSPKVVGNFNISCAQNGSINVQVAGGTPPYEFDWNHGDTAQNVLHILDAGQYTVHVTDANRVEITASITLTKAPGLDATLSPFVYANSKNTSCNTCTNGSINLSITGGTAPFTYLWTNGSIQQNPNNLAGGFYGVGITDAAGCTSEKTAMIVAPERNDWAMDGNSGFDSSKFLGSIDTTAFTIKTNNLERIKVFGNGAIKLKSYMGSSERYLKVNSAGLVITPLSGSVPWETRGNAVVSGAVDFIGTTNNEPFIVKTNAISRMIITADGHFELLNLNSHTNDLLSINGNTKVNGDVELGGTLKLTNYQPSANELLQVDPSGLVSTTSLGALNCWKYTNSSIGSGQDISFNTGAVGIGTDPLAFTSLTKYKLLVNGSIGAKEVIIRAGAPWPDYVFDGGYFLKPIEEVERFLKQYHHLPGMPTASSIAEEGQALGSLQILQQQKLEELYLYVLQLKKEIEILKQARK